MDLINHEALSRCIRDAVRAELQEHFKTGGGPPQDERLLSKQELSEELGVSLVTLTDWMKKGLPFLRLHKGLLQILLEPQFAGAAPDPIGDADVARRKRKKHEAEQSQSQGISR